MTLPSWKLVSTPLAVLCLFSASGLSCSAPLLPPPADRGGEGVGSVTPAPAQPPELRAAIIAARQGEGGPEYAYVSMGATVAAGGGLRAENPRQRLRIELGLAGVRLVHAQGTISLRLASWGCPAAMSEVGLRAPRVAAASRSAPPDRRAEYAEPGSGARLIEWYENGPMGLEQGFTVSAPPACPGAGGSELRFAVAIQGARSLKLAPGRSGEGARVELALGDGPQRLIYSDLDAHDATGKRLPSKLEVDGQQVVLTIDARAAQYPLVVDPLVWNGEAMLSASDATSYDEFGSSVAVSGDRAVVGADSSSAPGSLFEGAAYVFARSGTSWTQEAKLTASDKADGDHFGSAVAISGDTVLVGAPDASIGALTHCGAAYVYVRSGTSWTQQAKLSAGDRAASDGFGGAVAIAGDTAVAGAPAATRAGLAAVGAAYVFVRSGTSWTQQAELLGSDKAARDSFASSVAITGDTIAAGAPRASRGILTSCGEGYIFVRSGTSWTQQAELFASDRRDNDNLGASVAIDGDTVVLGAPGASRGGLAGAGAAYVFVRTGWAQQAILMASDKATSGAFGASVAVSVDTAVVGSGHETAYVFGRSGTSWTEQSKRTGGGGDHQFGEAVAISGALAVIGSRGTDIGAATGAGAAYVIHGGKASGDSCMGDSECASDHCVGGTCGLANGSPCTAQEECKTGFCTDGVCCQTDCAGGTTDCQACSKAAGAAADGTCGVLSAGMVCRSADASRCISGGTCDGSATTCNLKAAAATVVCSSAGDPASCIANHKCDGTTIGSCPTSNPTPADKLTVCSAKGDLSQCIAGYRCDGATVGSCPTTNPAPADDSTVCSTAQDASRCVASLRCDGMTAGMCPTTHPTPASSSTVCNAAGGASGCAVNYKCDGMSAGGCPTTNPTPAATGMSCGAGTCQAGQCRTESDLSLRLSGMPMQTTGQQPVQVQVQVENAGPGPAEALLLTLDLPTDPGFAVNQLAGDGWDCQRADASVRCTRSELPVGRAPSVTLQAIPPLGQQAFTIKGGLTASTFDPKPENNNYQLGLINVAPCSTACAEGGSDNMPASSGCQLSGRAPVPSTGWAFVALALIAWRLRASRRSHPRM